MLKSLEEKFGLPPLGKTLDLVSGPTGKRLGTLLSRLESLAQDKDSISQVITLLQTVERLDQAGTLTRLIELLKELAPLTKGKTAQLLVEKLDKLEKLVTVLLKEE